MPHRAFTGIYTCPTFVVASHNNDRQRWQTATRSTPKRELFSRTDEQWIHWISGQSGMIATLDCCSCVGRVARSTLPAHQGVSACRSLPRAGTCWSDMSVCHPSRHPNALRPRYAHSTYALSLHPLLIFKELQRLLGGCR